MINEKLDLIRQTLDQEDDEISILSVLKSHHKYLKEYMALLTCADIDLEIKQTTLNLFIKVFRMHARAEKETIYLQFRNSTNKEMRLEALKATDEDDIAYEIIDELIELSARNSWSEIIDAKIRLLAGLIKSHIKEEENILFPMAEKLFSESTLMDLADDYLDKCKLHLDNEMDTNPSVVSRNDVATFL